MAEKPFDVLQKSLEKRIIVVMKDGGIVTGVLKGWDAHMNVVLSDAMVKDEKKLGKVIIRGDSIVIISPE